MWAYIISAIIWIVSIKCIIQGIREHNASEAYEHFGLAVYFTLLVLNLGTPQIAGVFSDLLWLEIIGFILFIPSALLVALPIVTLERKGKTKTSSSPLLTPSDATVMLDTGIFGIVRHPLYLGTAPLVCCLNARLSVDPVRDLGDSCDILLLEGIEKGGRV
jgi:protein-S-isoprenylcysteine O-methyltransferase Ste14